jgi:hypothetical protein
LAQIWLTGQRTIRSATYDIKETFVLADCIANPEAPAGRLPGDLCNDLPHSFDRRSATFFGAETWVVEEKRRDGIATN